MSGTAFEVTVLPTRRVLQVGGEESASFLQGLISNDIHKATQEQAIYALLLTPQGKFLHDLFILTHDDGYLIDCDAARADDLLQRLTRYRLRAKVTLALTADWQVAMSTDLAALPDDAQAYTDPRLPALGVRAFVTHALPEQTEAYERHRIACGVPDGTHDLMPEQALPMEHGMDRLQAIDFAKGCFVGQEVTARTKHRANLRKAVYQVSSDAPLPPHGTTVTAADKTCGMMLSSVGTEGLALLRKVETEAALSANTPVKSEDVTLQVSSPGWR